MGNCQILDKAIAIISLTAFLSGATATAHTSAPAEIPHDKDCYGYLIASPDASLENARHLDAVVLSVLAKIAQRTAQLQANREFLLHDLRAQDLKSPGQGHLARFQKLILSRQEGFLKNLLNQRTASKIEALASRFADIIVKEGKALAEDITDNYASGVVREPEFNVLNDRLVQRFEEFRTQLAEDFPLPPDLLTSDLTKLAQLTDLRQESVTVNNDLKYSIELPQGQAGATFEPEIATLALRLNPPRTETDRHLRIINSVLLHGAGTNRSNVASWLSLLALAGQAGVQAIAFDLPGSVGEPGIALNSIRNFEEMGIYLELLARHAVDTATDPSLPLVMVGRSMGSTVALMSVIASSRAAFNPRADLWFLMSFSNPLTLDLQTQNVYALKARGDIKSVIEDSLDHSTALADDLQKHLKPVTLAEVSRRDRQTQDTVLFAQGAGDEDGTVPGMPPGSIVEELRQYRDTNLPFAHVYEFADPLAQYKTNGVLPGTNPHNLEGTHFLLSARGNMTPKNRESIPQGIPDKDLPQLRDQHYEVYGLQYAMLDYQIDRSPLTSLRRREELRHKRTLMTGSDQPFAYLSWYIENVINRTDGRKLTLDQILSDSNILPNREFGIEGRIKKIYEFCQAEGNRALDLLSRN